MSYDFLIEMGWKSAAIAGGALLLAAMLRSRAAADRGAVLKVAVARAKQRRQDQRAAGDRRRFPAHLDQEVIGHWSRSFASSIARCSASSSSGFSDLERPSSAVAALAADPSKKVLTICRSAVSRILAGCGTLR